jgi:hypothetical protein
MREPPHEETEQPGDRRKRDDLAGELRGSHAETM